MKKIGWQKYEDMLEQQLQSPLLEAIYDALHMDNMEDLDESFEEEMEQAGVHGQAIPLDQKMMENITLTSNFDCWMGHTNFNITQEVREELDQVDGVEILKICSRYRFFLGVGKMFDFSTVRKNIEKTLSILNGENIE